MAYDFQVAVDCADPHAQADWWAETLGWQVERGGEEFIKDLIARGATFLHPGQQGPHSWFTMADPEGNEFCIT